MQELKAKPREVRGKKVKQLRQQSMLPAVLYGEGVPSQSLSLSYSDFEKVYRSAGESSLLKLDVDGTAYNVLIHDVAHHALHGKPIHADFYAVRMDRPIRVKIPITFLGESPAVKNEGGILVKVMHELEVEALPTNLPHQLDADLNALMEVGSHLTVRDLVIPQDVRVDAGLEEIIAVVEAPKTADELTAEKETSGEVIDVKTEREEKMAQKAQKEEEETDKE
ncbi:MAG: large subunit ribosomal protein L25 [Parcubacteria group bacterium Gr01-1014_66]|nr:MAG: large subunit ribosomal protein L25 [Parcubacteria group bacterium Gr01-1014_66]